MQYPNPKNNQEVFDFVLTCLLIQGEMSGTSETCLYRQPVEGKVLKCAAGHLLPDEAYNSSFEGWGVSSPPDNPVAFWFQENGYDNDFIWKLQEAHDNPGNTDSTKESFREDMLEKFECIAYTFGLEF